VYRSGADKGAMTVVAGRAAAMVLLCVPALLCAGCPATGTPPSETPAGRGTVVVSPEPDSLMAPWILTRDDIRQDSWSGMGETQLRQMSRGEYTIEWSPANGFVEPPPITAAHVPEADLTFTGSYTPE